MDNKQEQEHLSMKYPELKNRKIVILYGSETGNSESLAEDLGRLAERLRFQTWVSEMEDVGLKTLTQYHLAIFVTSTTGQGEFPKNARKLWRLLLRKKLSPTTFSSLKFTTFGLGDSSYSKFSVSARKLHRRLLQLGAVEFYPRGEGDERHDQGIDGTYLPWVFGLHNHLLSEYPLPEGLSPIPPDVQLPPKFTIELAPTATMPFPAHVFDDALKAALFTHPGTENPEALELDMYQERTGPHSIASSARLSNRTAAMVPGGIHSLDRPNVLRDCASQYCLKDPPRDPDEDPPLDKLLPIPDGWDAELVSNTRATPDHYWQDVRNLVLFVPPRPGDTPGTLQKLYYKPGDVTVLYPKNFPKDVQTLIDHMGWNEVADKPFVHHSHPPKNCYPLKNSTLRQLLIHNYDITAIPTRSLFNHLKFFTDDTMARQKLNELGDPVYDDEFNDYVPRPRRSILEILLDFPSVRIPYQWVPTIFPVIRGREYSIASGGVQALVEDSDDDGMDKDDDTDEDEVKGMVRVELLVALIKYKTILRKTRQGLCSRYIESLEAGDNLRISVRQHTGPPLAYGAGLPPPLERPLLAIAAGTGVAPIRSYLWERFSIAKPSYLFLGFRKHDADFHYRDEWESELSAKVFTAFSRDQREKIYVQDIVRREVELVCDLVNQQAIICLCGSSGQMPKAVRKALCDVTVAGGLFDNEAVAAAKLFRDGYYWEEVW